MRHCPITESGCADIVDCDKQCMLEAIMKLDMEPEAPKLDNSEIGLVLAAGPTTLLPEQAETVEPGPAESDEPEPKQSLHVPYHILNN